MKRRRLSDSEIAVLMAVHAGIDPAKFLDMVDVEITIDPDDAEEITPMPPMWKYRHKLRFLLQIANYPNTH